MFSEVGAAVDDGSDAPVELLPCPSGLVSDAVEVSAALDVSAALLDVSDALVVSVDSAGCVGSVGFVVSAGSVAPVVPEGSVSVSSVGVSDSAGASALFTTSFCEPLYAPEEVIDAVSFTTGSNKLYPSGAAEV